MVYDPPGGPSQRYYHVPRDWLRAGKNTLLLFEETGGTPAGVNLVCRREKRTDNIIMAFSYNTSAPAPAGCDLAPRRAWRANEFARQKRDQNPALQKYRWPSQY
jgi:hypothetical protein